MSTTKKIILGLVGLFVLIPLILVISFATFVNPNQYKSTLTQIASNKLNRKIEINGNLEWSFFPLGITMHNLEIANDPKFKDPAILTSQTATISLKILPLFSKKYEVDSLYIDKATISLAKNADNYNNWQSMLTKQDEIKVEANKQVVENIKEIDIKDVENTAEDIGYFQLPVLPNVSIGKIAITDSTVTWTDHKEQVSVEHINLNSNNFSLQDKANFRVYGSFRSNFKSKQVSIFNDFDMQIDLQSRSKVNLNFAKFNMELGGKAYPKHPYLKFSGAVDADLLKNYIKVYDLDSDLNSLKISGELEGEINSTTRSLNGHLKLVNSNLGTFLDTLNYAHTNQHYQHASGEIKFTSNNEFINIDPIKLSLDSDDLNGNITIDAKKSPYVINSNLTANHINFNKLALNKSNNAAKVKHTPEVAAVAQAAPPVDDLISNSVREILQNVNLTAKNKIEKVIVNDMTIQGFTNSATIKKGVIETNTTFDLYKGKTNIASTVDINSAIPLYKGTITLTNFKMEDLLKDTIESDKLSGDTNFNFNYTSKGNSNTAIMRNMNGDMNLVLTNGLLKGVNLDSLIDLLNTKISVNPGNILESVQSVVTFTGALMNNIFSSVSNSGQTKIVSLTAFGTLNQGIITNNDLKLKSKLVEVNGSGALDILNDNIKYGLIIHDIHEPDVISKLEIPVQIYGKLSSPKYSVGTPKGKVISKTFKEVDKVLKQVPILEKLPLDKLPLEQIDNLLHF